MTNTWPISALDVIGYFSLLEEKVLPRVLPPVYQVREQHGIVLLPPYTEIGGLCVGPLADRLVVLCGLNDQNVEGTRRFLDLIGIHPRSSDDQAEPWDDSVPAVDDEPSSTTLGPKPTLLIASPVPSGEIEYKQQRMECLEAAIGLEPLALYYHPRLALMETVFIRDFPKEELANQYIALGERVMGMVSDMPEQLESRFWQMLPTDTLKIENRNSGDSMEVVTELLARAWVASKPTLSLQSSGLLDLMYSRLGIASELEDRIAQVRVNLATSFDDAASRWANWAGKLLRRAMNQGSNIELLRQSLQKSSRALAIKVDHHEALNLWGAALGAWAKQKSGPDAARLFAEADEKLDRSLAIKPDFHDALFNRAWLKALQGDAAGCVALLRQWASIAPSVSGRELEGNADFDRIRNDPAFLAFCETLPG